MRIDVVAVMHATATHPSEGQGFVTARYLAKFYSVTVPTIFRWAKEEKIPSTRFQGTVRFNLESVRAAIEGTEVKK
jgi:predicted DNA-binding transcriptional regulator AlpA